MQIRLLLVRLLSFTTLCITAQSNLSRALQTSVYTYIYKITGNEAEALYRTEMRTRRINGYPHNLVAGTTVRLQAELTVRAASGYVMIEIPIPAGCSYLNKEQPYANGEVHREYFRNKVHIFFADLKPGKYQFGFDLNRGNKVRNSRQPGFYMRYN